MKIIIGNDHAGISMKNSIIEYLIEKKYQIINLGINKNELIDYPEIGQLIGKRVIQESGSIGIIICGTGIGISIAANKIKGIRAAICNEVVMAKFAREHNDANILALGARIIAVQNAILIVDTFLNTSFNFGVHLYRVNKLNKF